MSMRGASQVRAALGAAIVCILAMLPGGEALCDHTGTPGVARMREAKPQEKEVCRRTIFENPRHTARMRVTAYCSCERCCGNWADGVTASGHRITKGDKFAAAPRQYAFGTRLVVPGYNGGRAVEVLDRGGAIGQGRLDVYFDTHAEALAWGARELEAEILNQR